MESQMQVLTTEGLRELITLTKGSFVAKNDVITTNEVDIETTPTSGSTNLVTSGGVYSAIASASPSIDTITIDKNASNQLEAIGTIDKNAGGALYDWKGTLAEYTAQNIETTHPEWICFITDDNTNINWGDIQGTLANQTDLQNALNAKQTTLVSGTNIKTINSNSILGSGNLDIDGLPSQTGKQGQFLTTNGTSASWATVDALPSQTGQNGKFLTTDGTAASWAAVPTPTYNSTTETLEYN